MFPRFDMSDLLPSHVDSFRDEDTGKRNIKELLLLFFSPLVLASIGCLFSMASYVANLISAMSIFSGILISVNILIITLSSRVNYSTSDDYFNLMREFIINITYSIVIGVVAVLFIIVSSINYDTFIIFQKYILDFNYTFRFISIYLSFHFFINLLFVINRLYNFSLAELRSGG